MSSARLRLGHAETLVAARKVPALGYNTRPRRVKVMALRADEGDAIQRALRARKEHK
jgi:hypothetical protein